MRSGKIQRFFSPEDCPPARTRHWLETLRQAGNAGLNFDHKRYLGNISVGHVDHAYWQDVTWYGGWTDAYTVVNLTAGARIDRSGNFMAMLKISNLANGRVQNHIYGDIIKRQITGEFRMRF